MFISFGKEDNSLCIFVDGNGIDLLIVNCNNNNGFRVEKQKIII